MELPCTRCAGTGIEPNNQEIGHEMRVKRLAAGLTLTDVCDRMGIGKPYLSDLELGRRLWRKDLRERFLRAVSGS